MKKLLFNFLFVGGSLVSLSQNNNTVVPPQPIEQSIFSFGVKGGFGHSFIVPYNNYAFMPSWGAGISAVYSPFEHIGIGMDVLYSKEGMRANIPGETFDVDLNYIRVPIKAIYFFRKYEEDFRPKVSIGPSLGFLIDASDNDLYNVFDLGASASLGFNYRLARAIWLNVDATYNQGFLDYRSNNAESDLNGNLRLELGLSVGF